MSNPVVSDSEISARPVVRWFEGGTARCARWRSESGASPPKRVVIAEDDMSADTAYGLACQGTALLWRGDFHNARQLLLAMARRADHQLGRPKSSGFSSMKSPVEVFHLHRQARAQRARTLCALLVSLDDNYGIALPRAPDIRQACVEAYGPASGSSVAPLRALLGLIGAHEWRTKGIDIAAVGGRIHPHYGVFTPIRHEYVELVARTPLPAISCLSSVAFDIGTGTGVLAAVLARRGFERIVATDKDPRALACARENLERLGLSEQVKVVPADLFPEGQASLVVCNPPWVPARPSSPIERGIYDPESRMLRAFLDGLPAHLNSGGEGWLILSDIAEHLGLRTRSELISLFCAAGLVVLDRSEVRPIHRRAADKTDPLHAARAAEVTSLWRLAVR
jgi:SAM-dependent methyltransferase